MAITERQKQLVQQSFAKVEPIAEQAAEIFYSTLFEYDPALRPLFKNSIKSQGQKLMATLKLAVAGLDDLDKLVPVLQSLAERHVGYGVKAKDFTPVGNALLHTLKVGLGEQWNDELRQAWVDTIHIVADVMKAHAFAK
ncbi:hemin receptor [Pseudoalteromonas sp. JBTF-M23]|uniref:Hemin receptor n=1 Tax=Pseudoalteromonas caenipelagi TaxID=2726988 RepID=A0A849VES9_9GAMM|nr:globin family protein [Pseudoalteromonas caenipelagi]NOU51892.1 hemin receptor [Pseudoalteromonas caenipelagi]